MPTVRVAVTQAEPEWLDLQKTVEKTCKLIKEAASNGAKLVAFPEAWIPGYPAWIWARLVDPNMTVTYIKNSLSLSPKHTSSTSSSVPEFDSPEIETLLACAAENAINVSLGYSENDGHSLYIGQCLLTADGKIEARRRKLKATHMERTVFGDASGGSLMNVAPAPDVGRVGALSCWEHIQPLLKYHTFLQREEVHVAAWPPVYKHSGGEELWSMSREGVRNLSQTYAVESGTFVLHCSPVLTQRGIEKMQTQDGMLMSVPGGGCSAVYGPDGRQLTDDLPETEEGIIYADLDLDNILKVRAFADSCGHYSRPDMLWLGVDSREKFHRREEKQDI